MVNVSLSVLLPLKIDPSVVTGSWSVMALTIRYSTLMKHGLKLALAGRLHPPSANAHYGTPAIKSGNVMHMESSAVAEANWVPANVRLSLSRLHKFLRHHECASWIRCS